MERGVGFGALAGIVAMLLLGWVPLVGPLIAGYLGGIHTSDRKQGAIVGFLAGAVEALAIVFLFFAIPSTVFVVTEGPLSGWMGNVFTNYYALGPLFIIATTVLAAVIGGVFGGSFNEIADKR